ncbi:MAG: heme A synthase [Bacteroidetes bacterium]|nr:heme A synthase [Bacteroidota bacterium]
MKDSLVNRSDRPVRIWLWVGIFMIVVQVLLGGITRLTGSGLSITEWNVVTGTFPPLNETDWLLEFNKYKATPQYQLLNFDFDLDAFKFIFFWEWFHRFWARLIGVVFLIPFLVFLYQRRFTKEMVRPLLILFLLGALQGAVGWIMVASGLTGDAIYVKPTRLALHFQFALGLFVYTFWFAIKLTVGQQQRIADRFISKLTITVILLLVVQLAFGALMAGHKAATAAPTWPDINGAMVPELMWRPEWGLLNFLENKILIHFVHRTLAYIILILVGILSVNLYVRNRQSPLLQRVWWLPLFFVTLQVVLGIASVLLSVQIVPRMWGPFEWAAQLHQLVAMFLLMSLVAVGYLVRSRETVKGTGFRV